MSPPYPTGLVTTLRCCGDVILGAGGGGHTTTCPDGDCTGPGLGLPCECGVPILGDGCTGDMIIGLPGLCIRPATADPGECVTIGPGLFSGELCCVIGEEDAVGDIIGDCGVWIGELGGWWCCCARGECICCWRRGEWPWRWCCCCLFCCLFLYSFI